MIEKRKILGNSVALLINRLVQSITSFILIAAIARIRGSYELGQYVLASGYYYVFVSFSAQGLRTLFIRDLCLNPAATPIYLANGTILQFGLSTIGYLALSSIIFLLPYDASTSNVCYLLGVMIFPFSLWNITEAVFQSRDQMYLVTFSTAPIYILRTLFIIGLLQQGYGVFTTCLVMVLSEVAVLLCQWGLVLRITRPKWQIQWDLIWNTLRAAKTFLALEGVAILGSRSQLIILSLWANEAVIGIYGGLLQLVQPFEIIAGSLVGAVVPSMTRAVERGKEQQHKLVSTVISILLAVALPCVLGVWFFGDALTDFVYGDPDFKQATTAFSIISLRMILIALTLPIGALLVANGLERIDLTSVVYGFGLGTIISFILVPIYQLMGAALGVLNGLIGLTRNIHYVNAKLFKLNPWWIIQYPLLVTGLMLIVFMILAWMNMKFLFTLLSATFIYLAIIGISSFYLLKDSRIKLGRSID